MYHAFFVHINKVKILVFFKQIKSVISLVINKLNLYWNLNLAVQKSLYMTLQFNVIVMPFKTYISTKHLLPIMK